MFSFRKHPQRPIQRTWMLCFLLVALLLPTDANAHCSASAECHVGPQPSRAFVQAANGALTLDGKMVRIKGVNYYPQGNPWSTMWWNWNGPQIARELRMARNDLGINTVRILVPYNFSGGKNGLGKLSPKMFTRLREITQIAGDLDMRLIVTLFDFYYNFEQPGTPEFDRDIAYVRAVVGAFANDERILAWDIHNEPDHYGAWNDKRDHVQNWLGLIADEIHAIAPRQLVTVGMGKVENLWLPGPDGRTALDYSDVVSVHVYDPSVAMQQLEALQAQTTKPIIIEEFGWPTDPPCLAPNYTEATQEQLYRDVLAIARDRTSGVMAWTLRDYDYAPTMRWNSREEHFGLYRADDSQKPAASVFAAEHVPPLPNSRFARVPLSAVEQSNSTDKFAPVLVPGTTFYVKGMFRRAWELMGGRESFGLPLGDAFQRPNESVATQYFERAVLQYTPDARNTEDYNDLSDTEKVRRTIHPQPLTEATTAPAEDTVSARFAAFYRQIDGSWRLGKATGPEHATRAEGTTTWQQDFEFGRLEYQQGATKPQISVQGPQAWVSFCAQTSE